MGRHLANRLPYEGTTIDPLTTRAEIDAMLHEFIMIDPETRQKTAWVSGIRWTDIPPEMPVLEFGVTYVIEGVKKQTAVRLQPPLFYKKKKRVQGVINEPQAAQSMRLLYWYLKSKLEAVLFGLNDVTKEFLSEVLYRLPDGSFRTVGETITEQIQESRIPALPGFEKEDSVKKLEVRQP